MSATNFRENIISIHGPQGKKWLNSLPKRISEIAKNHHLSNLKPVSDMSFHYVVSGLQNTQPVILKLGLDKDSLKREASALSAFKGYGAIPLYADDTDFLLLEHATPGLALTSYFPEKDQESIQVTTNLIKQLHKAPIPTHHPFPHIKDWLKALDRDLPMPSEILQKARILRDELLNTSGPDVLLHGDLHHANILQHKDEWVVIDPKGVIGESAYEIAAFIRNPIPELLTLIDTPEIIQNRMALFSEHLSIPKDRILAWCFVQTVLAWAWNIEDSLDTTYFKNLIHCFEDA